MEIRCKKQNIHYDIKLNASAAELKTVKRACEEYREKNYVYPEVCKLMLLFESAFDCE